MAVKLSAKRQKVLDFISQFIERKGYPPSIRDIVSGCDISSTSVAQYYVKALQRDGYIRKESDVSRSIAVSRPSGIPVLGTIAAGQPIPVPSADTWTSTPEETVDMPSRFARDTEGLFALKVKGSSMIDALIEDGDIVIMRAARIADDGETVAVWLKDKQEVTLKKLYHDRGRIRLQPANSSMQPIYAEPENVEIQGKVVAVLRKFEG
jgi:repressor LexA